MAEIAEGTGGEMMEFVKALETIRQMHKVCACGPNQHKATGKPLCPLYHTAFPCTDIVSFDIEDEKVEELISAWAAYYPEPKLPTLRELLNTVGITVRCDGTLQFNTRFEADKPISADFAQMQKEVCVNTACLNCSCYESEWQYCFRLGCHVPETGCCGAWKEKVEPKE